MMTKRLLAAALATTAAISASPIASAADIIAATPVYKAPVSQVYSWTGCYIGANAGGGSNRQDFTNVNPLRLPNFDLGSERATGAIGGGQIGCDYQAASWVFGLQGMFDAADFKGSNRVLPGPADPQFPNVFDLSSRTSWLATATARIGYTITPQLLMYAKGGAAWTRSDLSYTVTGQGVSNYTAAETRTGWVVGGGLEYLIAPNWSVFVEYNYMDFGSGTLNTQNIQPALGAPPEPIRISHRIDTVMLGLNYRFGGGPVVAKY